MRSNKSKSLIDRVDVIVKNLASQVDEVAQSEMMRSFFNMCAKFHKYSPNNIFLILIERPDATFVAGYLDWRSKFSRQVIKGEKGIPILAPCTYKKCNLRKDDPDYDPSSQYQVVRGFRVVNVFDISQTDGDPLPDIPDWKSLHQDKVLDQLLIQFAASQDIKVEYRELKGEAQGYSKGSHIVIAPSAGTKTLLHELAHELLCHRESFLMISKSNRELEAESVAYVVSTHFNIPDLASPNYLALYQADSDKIMKRLNRIRSAATKIIQGVEKLEASNGHH